MLPAPWSHFRSDEGRSAKQSLPRPTQIDGSKTPKATATKGHLVTISPCLTGPRAQDASPSASLRTIAALRRNELSGIRAQRWIHPFDTKSMFRFRPHRADEVAVGLSATAWRSPTAHVTGLQTSRAKRVFSEGRGPMSSPICQPLQQSPLRRLGWRPAVVIVAALLAAISMFGLFSPSAADAAPASVAQCNGQRRTWPGGTYRYTGCCAEAADGRASTAGTGWRPGK